MTMNQQLTVLYVEDDPQSRTVMKLLLAGRMGLEHVTILLDSADFSARVQQLTPPPNLIFLDIHVEPFDGFEMLRQLRALPQFAHTPIVALTASLMNEEVHQLRASGFDGCLAKPLDVQTFPALIARILAGEKIWRITE